MTSLESPSHLLMEESTIDPNSSLPSFLELSLVESATRAAQKALIESMDAFVTYLLNRSRVRNNPNGSSSFGQVREWGHGILQEMAQALGRHRAEVCCILTYLMERTVLCSGKDASFSESLYGFKRSRVESSSSSSGALRPLDQIDQIRSALWLALGPYMQRKLDGYHERVRDESYRDVSTSSSSNPNPQITNHPMSTHRRRHEAFRSMMVYLYPFLRMTHQGVQLFYQFFYLIGRSVYASPSLHLLGIILRRQALEEQGNQPSTSPKRANTPPSSPTTSLPSIHEMNEMQTKRSNTITTIMGIGVLSTLTVGWIAGWIRESRRRRHLYILQQLSKAKQTMGRDGTETIRWSLCPPPLPPPISHDGDVIELPNDYSLCPLCLRKRVNPVAASSGYVFCYKCLVMHIREKGAFCPLTKIPIKEGQEIRLYEST